ncbi:MAG: hypothetical protein VX588_08555 [Verrucomicrobiota bacterium]|nr:hypothetical protein [Verrucomicrobiota bacterium]|tara:strand:+ start:202 stop:786 length:585 start_codon:yes stop_codon:yes gene_type:complete
MKHIQLIITLLLSVTSVLADKNQEISKHPATQVTFSYLRNAMGQDWEKAAQLIEPLSLENLKARYILKIKASSTFDEEIARVRRVDCANIREVEKLDAVDFYVRYHKGVQQRFKVDQEILDKILASLGVKLLSLAEDTVGGKDYCHILVRTRHSNGDKQISALDLVSLVKIKDTWKVTLNAQQPVVKKVESPPK